MNALESALSEIMPFPLFAGYPRGMVLELCAGGRIATTDHRQVLFQMGEPASAFAVVLSGAYKLTKHSPGGSDVIVHFSTPGDVIAALIMPQAKPMLPVTAVSMGPSRAVLIPRETYLKVWKSNPELIFRIQNLLSTRMHLLQNHKMLTRAPLTQRVADLLLNLADEKTKQGSALELSLPLTRKEIADSLGASVEAVIRIMSDWSKLGYISTTDQQIRVERADKIIDISIGAD